MALLATWKVAKQAFETTTGKKKPSAKTLGFFRKSTGIEDALKSLDTAKGKDDYKKHLTKFTKAKDDYIKILKKSETDAESDATYKDEIGKLIEALKRLEAEAVKSGPKPKAQKFTVGPLKFNLLSDVGKLTNLLADRLDVLVQVNVVFESEGDVVQAAQITEAASNYIDTVRSELTPKLKTADAALGKCIQTKDAPGAEKIEEAIQAYLAKLESDVPKRAQAEIQKKVAEIFNRQVDAKLHKVNTGVRVVFNVVRIGAAGKDLFDKPGLGFATAIFKIVKSTWDIIKVIRINVKGVISLRDNVQSELGELEKKRLLHLKDAKTKTDVAKDIFNQVKEALLDDIGDVEYELQAFSTKVTGYDAEAKKLGAKLNELLNAQQILKREKADDAIVTSVKDLIASIQTMQGNYGSLLQDETSFKGSLTQIKADQSKPVKFVKFVIGASALTDPVDAAELLCKSIAKKLAESAKK